MAHCNYKYSCYPYYQMPVTYVTPQCNSQNYIAMQQYLYNAYLNQLRKLQNREITMEYWTRQLEYFRNLLKNFSAEIETPADLKKLLATCNYDPNTKNCFEKRRTFNNIDKLFCNCRCNACIKRTLMRLCNALSNPWPCNKSNCATCCPKPCQKQPCGVNYCQKQPCYYYMPCQPTCQMPYYYYNCPQQAFSNCCNRQQYNNFCPGSCDMCCNKCRFKYILNKINWLLTSAEQLKPCPCTCTCKCSCACPCDCACPKQKSCCSMEQVKEETIIVKHEDSVETNKKPCEGITQCVAECGKLPECDDSENSAVDNAQMQTAAHSTPRVSFNPKCNCVYEIERKRSSTITKSRNYSESTKCNNSFSSCSGTFDECKNPDTFKKQISIALGKEYRSPSGNFQVLVENQENVNANCPCRKNSNGDYFFEVDYITYTMPKCQVANANANDI